jgi:hypothetical protein
MGGGDLGALAQRLGHEDVRTTNDYYGIYALGQLQELLQRHSPMSKLFSNGKGDWSSGPLSALPCSVHRIILV